MSPSPVPSEIVSNTGDFLCSSSVVPDMVIVAPPLELAASGISSLLSFLTITVCGDFEVGDFTTVTPNKGGTVGLCTVTVVPIAETEESAGDCVTTAGEAFFAASCSSAPPMAVVAVWSLALPKAEMISVICGLPHCFLAASAAGFITASPALVAGKARKRGIKQASCTESCLFLS